MNDTQTLLLHWSIDLEAIIWGGKQNIPPYILRQLMTVPEDMEGGEDE